MASGSKVSSDVISQAFPQPNVPGQNVSLSMWYYMEGWTEKNLSFVLEDSTGSQTMFVKMDRQSRRWKYCKLEFSVNTTSTFQVSTIEPPLMITSLQRPPLYNGHLPTTATSLQRPPPYNGHLSTTAISMANGQDFSSRPCVNPYTLLSLKPPYNDHLSITARKFWPL